MAGNQDKIIAQLKKWATCDIADAMSRCGHLDGGYLEGINMLSPVMQSGDTKIAGRVFTVKVSLKTDKETTKFPYGNYIDHVPESSIVFLAQPRPHVHACFGGLMSRRALKLGAAGVVVDGVVRDLQEQRDLGMPVFARKAGTTASNAISFVSDINVPLHLSSSLQEATVLPTDYIIADLDGVVHVPEDDVQKVLQLIPGIVSANQKCAEAIGRGMSAEEAMATFRGK